MIQPAINSAIRRETISQKTHNWNSGLILYYIAALSLSVLNFAPVASRSPSAVVHTIDSQILWSWILSCCILSIPLFIEFILDTIAAATNPIYYQHILEHRFGHVLILFSLCLPAVLLGPLSREFHFDPLLCHCVLSFCEALSVSAVFGKLQVFGLGKCWKAWNSLVIFILFVVTQLVLNFEMNDKSMPNLLARNLSAAVGFVRLFLLIWFARGHFVELIALLFHKNQRNPVNSNKYRAFAFLGLILLYFLARLIANIYFLSISSSNLERSLINRIAMLMMLSVGSAVIPGRMIRRGVVALKVGHKTFCIFLLK